MYIEDSKFEIERMHQEETIGRKYSTKFTTPTQPRLKDTKKAVTNSLNLNLPIGWEMLSKMSTETQKQYIQHLHTEYKALSKEIAQMLGIHPSWFSVKCKELGVNLKIGSRKRKPEEEAWWQRFLRGEAAVKEEAPVKEPEKVVEPEPQEQPKAEKTTAIRKVSMEFDGQFDPAYIIEAISRICGDAQNAKVYITVEL